MENDSGCPEKLGTEPAPPLIAEVEELQAFATGLQDRGVGSAGDILGYGVRGLRESPSTVSMR